jgi:predicted dehydrogenase
MRRRIRVGVIGGGSIAKAHVIGLRGVRSYFGDAGVEAEVVVIGDVAAEVARASAERYGVDHWSADWEAVLADDSIDAVTVAVPNDRHAQVVIAAARAGKAVLCEKPLANKLASAREMTAAVEAAGVTNAVNLNYRHIPAIRYAKQLVESGEIGEIVNFRGVFLQEWAADERVPRSWKFEASRAGAGPILGVGCHIVDLAQLLVGDITSVIATKRTVVSTRPAFVGTDTYLAAADDAPLEKVDTDDVAAMLVEFDGGRGAVGTIETSRVSRGRKNHCFIELNGTRGSLMFDYERMNEIYVASPATGGIGATRVVVGPEQDGGLFWTLGGLGVGFAETIVLEMTQFLQAIASGAPVRPSFADGLRAQAVIEAGLESATTRSWVSVSHEPLVADPKGQ